MLTSVRIYDELGNFQLKLPVAERDSTVPFIVKNITGLGPVTATVSTSTYAGQDGGTLQASKTGLRNIVMKIGYSPDYQSNQSIQSLRRDLYSYFAPKSEVRLRFYNDDYSDVRIVGVVESHEPSIFSKEPEVDISIICPYPFFNDIKQQEIDSYINTPVYPTFVGNAEAGLRVEVFISRSIGSISLESSPNTAIVYNGSMIANDILTISTVRGNKYARLTRDGDTQSVLDGISGSLNMVLGPLSSNFYVKAPGASDISYRLYYTPSFVGI